MNSHSPGAACGDDDLAFGVLETDAAVVELQAAVASTRPAYMRGSVAEVIDLFLELSSTPLKKLRVRHDRLGIRQSARMLIAHGGIERGVYAARNDPGGMNALLGKALDDLLAELA